MTIAFVLSGGGSLAAVQVGMMQALSERGVRPDILVGTSAGAINAAYVAGCGTGAAALEDLAGLWRGLRRRVVFPLRPDHSLLAAVGRPHVAVLGRAARPATGRASPVHATRDASTPVHVVGTDVLTADSVCALQRPPRHPAAAAMHALTLLLQQRAILGTRAVAHSVDVRVIPPLCPLTVSASDLGHARELIRRARRSSAEWLDAGADTQPAQEDFLSLHGHQRGAEACPHGEQVGAGSLD